MNRTTRAFRYRKHGGPQVLTFNEVRLPLPAGNEVQIRQTAIGVNYLDIYQRRGADLSIPLPSGIGVEGVGIVEDVGNAQTTVFPGDRVAYVGGPPGAYAESRNVPSARLVKLPNGIGDLTAGALIFKGLTAEYLIHRCVSVQPGQTVLFHAAAGGVGSIACQWLHARGVRVIGTVGSKEKIKQAAENGCEHVLLSSAPDFAAKVHAICGGVDVVYDSIGASTFEASLDCLRPRGMMVSFGAASGAPPEIGVAELARRGSLFLTRPSIAHYTADPVEYQQAADRLFEAIATGVIKTPKVTTFSLTEAPKAQAMLEGRKTTGSLVLVPNSPEQSDP